MGDDTNRLNSRTEPASVIPTPPGTVWREIRVRYLPGLIFCLTLFAIWQLWNVLPPGGGIRGIGDGAVSIISSPQNGFLQTEAVEPWGWVRAGEGIVSISPFDPAANLDLLQSRLQVARLRLEPSIPQRSAIDYEQLRVDSLRLKQELAMAKANLDLANKMLPRHEALLKEHLISRDVHDATVRDRNFYQAEVNEKTKAVEEIDKRLESLRAMSEPAAPGDSTIDQIMPALEEQLTAVATNWNPVLINAPISGEVQFLRRAGEYVRAGEPILVINSARADRIIAYLKQPLPFEPQVGQKMEVVTRSIRPKRFLTAISRVGARMEVLTNAIAYIAPGAVVDTGLPLVLPVPPGQEIRPGEVVDLVLRADGGPRSFVEKLFGAARNVQ